MPRIRHLAVGAAAVVAAVAVGEGAPTAADQSIGAFATRLTGGNEFPGPGDADGFGLAGVVVNASRGQVCYGLVARRIAPATMAHIHSGAAGTAGPIVVNLDPPTRGFSANCTDVEPMLAAQIVADPELYYVNVHNADFPPGAIRGQLR